MFQFACMYSFVMKFGSDLKVLALWLVDFSITGHVTCGNCCRVMVIGMGFLCFVAKHFSPTAIFSI